jgi:hypothetical protein
MRETIHTTRVFTPFGGGYLPEDHGPPLELSKGWGRWPLVLVVLLLVVTTVGAAIMATGRTYAAVPALWKQDPPVIFMKANDGYGARELLF